MTLFFSLSLTRKVFINSIRVDYSLHTYIYWVYVAHSAYNKNNNNNNNAEITTTIHFWFQLIHANTNTHFYNIHIHRHNSVFRSRTLSFFILPAFFWYYIVAVLSTAFRNRVICVLTHRMIVLVCDVCFCIFEWRICIWPWNERSANQILY